MERKRIKALIELSSNIDEADKVITDKVGLTTLREKLAFLKGMFDEIEIVSEDTSYTDVFIYRLWLQEIIEGHCSESH